jgi:ABC-type transport system involved in multi-copper enzyme maturation permease subunit
MNLNATADAPSRANVTAAGATARSPGVDVAGWLRLLRAELRKLTSTKMPWAFLIVLVVIAAINATAVVFGTDMDGSKTFISTAADQQSLVAFAANALMGATLFGAIAVAREYGYGTVVPTFLASPRRHRAVLAQLTAVAVVGAVLGLVGAALTIAALALSLPTTDYGFLVGVDVVVRLLAAAAYCGAAGAVLGAGIGSVVRNTGGAVTGAVFVLIIAPPLVVQLANGTGSWMPNTLANVLSGVTTEVSVVAAIGAIALWAVIPAAIGLLVVQRRDIV